MRRTLLIVAFTVLTLSLLLLFHFTQSVNNKSVTQSSVPQRQVVSKPSLGSPVRLKIPSINVDAAVEYVGVNTRGEMEVPSNTVDVGWFKQGVRPGDTGSAVISGHLNNLNGGVGVFSDLHKLKKGDKVFIEDSKGVIVTFEVRESRSFTPGYADEVFSRNDGVYLNLITCDGIWDGDKKSYSKRLVVFADIIP